MLVTKTRQRHEFMKSMKIENTNCYTKEEVDEINKYHEREGLDIDVDYTTCRKNPGMRAVAKLFSISLWG